MPRTVLIKLSELGEPCNLESVQNGVFILPALEPVADHKPGDALFYLRFYINAGAAVNTNGVLHTNVPEAGAAFERTAYRPIKIESSFYKDACVEVPIHSTGPFSYHITYGADGSKRTDTFYFTVPPQLTLSGAHLPLNAINIQSFVSKFAGPLENWDRLLGYIAGKGYNMIHFTPLQHRGESDSPYSIYDQLHFDPNLFESDQHAEKFLRDRLGAHGLLSVTDVVFNHTASNSVWLREYPESGYNAETAPHLSSAIELDAALLAFSDKLADLGLPIELVSERDLDAVMDGVDAHVLEPLKLWQYYVFDKQAVVQVLRKCSVESADPAHIPASVDVEDAESVAKYVILTASDAGAPVFTGRFANTFDSAKFLGILVALNCRSTDEVCTKAAEVVDAINSGLYATYDEDVACIRRQIRDRVRYLRLDSKGPRMGRITPERPLTERYFTRFDDNNGRSWALANNGWIWTANPHVDFASAESKAYLRREVIVWADCVKLRYGQCREESPYVWERMTQYAEMCARIFDGFRLDNCHSTPLHVGEALLDAARRVNRNLYVVAELFTGSEAMNKIFVERLGINSLILEAMLAWNVDELSRLVHKNGGRPIGSLTWLPLDEFAYPATSEPRANLYAESHSELEIPHVLSPQVPHALFMECSHDNQMPAQIRTIEDTLTTAALVAFCLSAVGSVFGYDETYPKILDIVQDKRQYAFDENNGVAKAVKQLSHVRLDLCAESNDTRLDQEIYVHHEGQYITIQRYNTLTGKGWFLIARTKFEEHPDPQVLLPVELRGTEVTPEFAYVLQRTGEASDDAQRLRGIPTRLDEIEFPAVEVRGTDAVIRVSDNFAAGSIAVFSTTIPTANASLDQFVKHGAIDASADLSLHDLNALLYRCEPEERDASGGADGTYTIPGHGALTYAGLAGWVAVLGDVIRKNDLGHPVCANLRNGLWAADYIVGRLDKYARDSAGMQRIQAWLRARFDAMRGVPHFLRPRYFALVVGVAYEAARFRALRLMAPEIQAATAFVQSLALTSVQMCGVMHNTSLVPRTQIPTLAAGLPHFSSSYMRCWGRDLFISFRGLLLVTGRFAEARQHLLAFAQTLKHGLIPNLLDAGRNPRYNARDAVWFFAQAVQEYVLHAPGGENILHDKVTRRFPLDDTWVAWDDKRAYSYESTMAEILYEIVARHARSISYREANAGPLLDSQMLDEGFNISIHVDWESGLVYGGSRHNCGTWMDKMGESVRAGNKGFPGTPRDGADVELQGLLKSMLRFLNDLNARGLIPYTTVQKADGSSVSLKAWEQLIQDNFERCFYVPEDASDDAQYTVDPRLVNRRGIYKDIFGCGEPYEDYQLRANFPIAMCVAPELFTPAKAARALSVADDVIRGPVGMRTLDPSDCNYRPYYRNSEDTCDFATAKGRNYHQGPEWVWCFGYFIRAFRHFKALDDKSSVLLDINVRLKGHRRWIRESPWAGLTELTNRDGSLCEDSSPTQAWSSSCLLDLYHDEWVGARE